MTEKHKALAEQYFEAYPDEAVLYISSDDQVFLQKNYNDGLSHQRRIAENTSLVTIARKDLIEKEDDEQLSFPDASWKKADIITWLALSGIEAKSDSSIEDLLKMVDGVIADEAKEEEQEEEEEEDLTDITSGSEGTESTSTITEPVTSTEEVVQADPVPDVSWTKLQIMDWLAKAKVEAKPTMKKEDLLELVKQSTSQSN